MFFNFFNFFNLLNTCLNHKIYTEEFIELEYESKSRQQSAILDGYLEDISEEINVSNNTSNGEITKKVYFH